jgi:DHA2 family multidrug resistance protein
MTATTTADAARTTVKPAGIRRTLLITCVMCSAIMQTLDTTIANVSLPYMQGSLSASLDQINWVLTSYIVAAAIMTAPVGWLAARFGRKRLFLLCTMGFSFASLLCSLSQDIEQMVMARCLQGMFGAALMPLAQSMVIDVFAGYELPKAQTIFGMGLMVGPVMGPTLGAWLTDTYSWHWVFLINLPFGVVATIGMLILMDETPPNTSLRFDWFGFIALAIGIGALQLVLDRGEQVGWYDSSEIIVETIVAIVGVYYFLAHSLTTSNPFVRLEIFHDRNFASACIFMVVMSSVMMSTMALVSPFLQQVGGYPVLTAGLVLASRGCGTFLAMMAIRSSMRYIEARTTLMLGLLASAGTFWMMTGFTNETPSATIFLNGVLQGFSFGMVFVSVNTVAFLTLPNSLRTYASSFQTLVRNISSSFGISVVISQLTEGASRNHARLSEWINPFNDALKMPDVARMLDMTTDAGRALTDQVVNLQSLIISYSHDFYLVMIFTLCALPVAFVVGPTKETFRLKTMRPTEIEEVTE